MIYDQCWFLEFKGNFLWNLLRNMFSLYLGTLLSPHLYLNFSLLSLRNAGYLQFPFGLHQPMLRLGLLFLSGLNILHHDLSYMSSYFASFCPVSFEGTSFLFFKLFFHFLLIIFWCNICSHHLVVWMTVRHQTANLGHFLGMSPVVKIRKAINWPRSNKSDFLTISNFKINA